MSDSVISVIIGGLFTILGVIIGWILNEVSTERRLKPKLCFRLNTTPDSDLVEEGLRTKTSASEYSIEIFNAGQTPVVLESFGLYWKKRILIQCFLCNENMTILPYQNSTYVLTQQDAEALVWHCKKEGFKRCRIIADFMDGEKCQADIDLSWIHMRTNGRKVIVTE